MEKLIECVPNFSEGRRIKVIESLVAEIKSIENIKILDYSADEDHNRLVVTFVGPPEMVKKAIFRVAKKAVELIDMNKHSGKHPRIGAIDVIPFVPLTNTTMEECVKLARELGKEFGEKLKIPVYLYGDAATIPTRRELAPVRAYQYERLEEAMSKPEYRPDFGPAKPHPTAGACAIGARDFLIAFNVYLDTKNLEIAKSIARAIRAKDGGLAYVKALGIEIKKRNLVQVSMNLTNYPKTPIFRVFELIKAEAKRYGVGILSSEIIGMVPLDALIDVAEYYLQLENFKKEQVLERKLLELKK
jgi:glutamate formiminotransferase